MNLFFEKKLNKQILFFNALTIFLFSIALSYFVFFTNQNIINIHEQNKLVKYFELERSPTTKEISIYGIDLRINNDIGMNTLLNQYNIFATEKKVTNLLEADYIYINKNELTNNYADMKNAGFKFLTCFSSKYNNSCLFFKQQNGITDPYQEYFLYFLLKNKGNLPSIDGFVDRIKSANNIEVLTDLNLNITKDDILSYNNFFSNNSRFLYKGVDKLEFSLFQHLSHIGMIILAIFLFRKICTEEPNEDSIFVILTIIVLIGLSYGFSPFF